MALQQNLAAAGVAALTLLAGCSAAAPAKTAATTAASKARADAVLTAQAAAGALPRAAVPWRQVGPGWALAQYSANTGGMGSPVHTGRTTIYLVDPAGGRYDLASWPGGGRRQSWSLEAWSAGTREAVFGSISGRFYQLDLATGRLGRIALPGSNDLALGYTRPEGTNILVLRQRPGQHTKGTIERFNLSGKPQQVIATGVGYDTAAYDSTGELLAIGGIRGLELASNAGGIVRRLSVPGRQHGCNAIRWWSPSTVLAECFSADSAESRLWLVPASGATPTPLTPRRGNHGFDFGDFSAWQLTSGLYVNGAGACGSLVIGRQPRHGPEQQVMVPGAPSSRIITATRSRLLVQRINGCSPGNSLVWFNPATRALTVAVPDRHHQWGVQQALPYFIQGRY